MVRGEIWWADTPGGDRPVLVLTRDPVADRMTAIVVALCTRTIRGLQSELPLDEADGMPEPCVVSFDNVHTIRRSLFRSRITKLTPSRMQEACHVLARSVDCQ